MYVSLLPPPPPPPRGISGQERDGRGPFGYQKKTRTHLASEKKRKDVQTRIYSQPIIFSNIKLDGIKCTGLSINPTPNPPPGVNPNLNNLTVSPPQGKKSRSGGIMCRSLEKWINSIAKLKNKTICGIAWCLSIQDA